MITPIPTNDAAARVLGAGNPAAGRPLSREQTPAATNSASQTNRKATRPAPDKTAIKAAPRDDSMHIARAQDQRCVTRRPRATRLWRRTCGWTQTNDVDANSSKPTGKELP